MPETALGPTSPASRTAVTVVDDGSVATLLRSLYAVSLGRRDKRRPKRGTVGESIVGQTPYERASEQGM